MTSNVKRLTHITSSTSPPIRTPRCTVSCSLVTHFSLVSTVTGLVTLFSIPEVCAHWFDRIQYKTCLYIDPLIFFTDIISFVYITPFRNLCCQLFCYLRTTYPQFKNSYFSTIRKTYIRWENYSTASHMILKYIIVLIYINILWSIYTQNIMHSKQRKYNEIKETINMLCTNYNRPVYSLSSAPSK